MPGELLDQRRGQVDNLTFRLGQGLQGRLSQEQKRLAALSGTLDALSPLKVLSRGFAVVSKGQDVVKSAAQASPGDQVRIRLEDGTLSAEILEKED